MPDIVLYVRKSYEKHRCRATACFLGIQDIGMDV